MALNYTLRTVFVRCAVRNNVAAFPSRLSHNSLLTNRHSLSLRSFSEERTGIVDRIKGSFEDRNKRKQAEQYAEQLEKMANTPVWTLGNFAEEVEATVPSGWRSKIPGVSNTQQSKAAQETKRVLCGILDEVGATATSDDLEKLGRKEKLRISLKTDMSVEELNIMIQQFKGMNIMHQVLRKQKLEGKPVPTDEQSMKALVQTESANVMSKSQKRELQERRMKKGMHGFGRPR